MVPALELTGEEVLERLQKMLKGVSVVPHPRRLRLNRPSGEPSHPSKVRLVTPTTSATTGRVQQQG